MRYIYLLLAFSVCLPVLVVSQPVFTNRNDLLRFNDTHSGVPVGIADMNGDGLDDIVSLHDGTELYIQYQTPDGARPFSTYKVPVHLDEDTHNDICIGDFNNDGANDIFVAGFYDRLKIIYSIPYTFEFDLNYITVIPFFSQGASTGDFNNDGWLDVVVLNDNGLNYTMMNDGTGNLTYEEYIDFRTVPVSDNSGNYGSVYTDFDMDGDFDFFIAKCRQGVNDPTDPRRINALYENDGNNNYTENAAPYGLANGRQSWTADFGDIDNDGDLDLFITQHDVMSELYENINNDTFINITASAGLTIGGIPLQGMFRDFDNDGFQDLLVSGDRIDYYHNNGDKTFTKSDPFNFNIFGTYALGDLNYDGFTDIYASTVQPFNNPDELDEDILFLNQKNGNHFLAMKLKNTIGNPSSIGSVATLYGAWGIQVREVRGGEQYGISNSHSMIFGLGSQTSYDSLVIRWPDGTKERYNNLTIDNTWNITRGGCSSLLTQQWGNTAFLCGGDSITLAFSSELPFQWSTGASTDSIVVKSEGIYYVTYEDENGCPIQTWGIEISSDPDSTDPVIVYDGGFSLCDGEIATLTLPEALGYTWSNGETTRTIEVTATGSYSALVQGFCNQVASDTIDLTFLIPELPVTTGDTFETGESVLLTASGDSIIWYDPTGINIVGTGTSLAVNDLTETTTYYAQNVLTVPGDEYKLGPVQQQGTSKYNGPFVNGGLIFDVFEQVVLNTLTVFTDSAGTRIIEISNGSGFLHDLEVFVDTGKTIIQLDVTLEPGTYQVSTNVQQNMLEFGQSNPWFWRSDLNVDFPYEIDDVISIRTSTFGEGFYYYFYDWQITTADSYCASELVPVIALFDMGVATNDPLTDVDVIVKPNPSSGFIQIEFPADGDYEVSLTDLTGQVIPAKIEKGSPRTTIDFSTQPPGVYIVQVAAAGKTLSRKIVKL